MTSTTPTDRPCRPHHPLASAHVGECHLCTLAQTNAAYSAWADPPTASLPIPVVCPHRGKPTGERRECVSCGGRVQIPLLACGLHGKCSVAKPLDGVACCAACDDNPERKPGYYTKSTTPRDPWANPVSVPTPPPFTPRTTSRRAVVTVVAGGKGRDLWAISGPFMRAYAERLGAELVVSTWEGNPAFGMSSKFGIGPIAAAFDEVVYADADIIFQPTTADLFAMRRDKAAVFAFNDLPYILMHAPEFAAEYQRVRESQRMPRCPVPWYLNTGLVVMNRRHAAHIAPPPHPIPTVHCAEQHLWVARMYEDGCPVEFMTNDVHHQWWVEGTMQGAPPWAALHFSGMSNETRRLNEMRRVAASLTAPK